MAGATASVTGERVKLLPVLHGPPQFEPLRVGTSWDWWHHPAGSRGVGGEEDHAPKPTVTLRRVVLPAGGPIKKLKLFFIRHGESQWNAGQAATHSGLNKLSKAVGGLWDMFSQTDHPLSKEGVDQALKTNRAWMKERLKQRHSSPAEPEGSISSPPSQHWEEGFMGAKRIYASPLTRALQTALVVLWRHPTLQHEGLTLLASLREVKNLGGQDTVGCAIGPGIQVRRPLRPLGGRSG